MIRAWFALSLLCVASAAAQTPPGSWRDLTSAERAEQREQMIVEAHIARIIRDHVLKKHCWRPPGDEARGRSRENTRVVVRFSLDADGALVGEPRIMSPAHGGDSRTRLALERTLQAVRACSPFPLPSDPIAGNRYDLWREIELTFDSSEL